MVTNLKIYVADLIGSWIMQGAQSSWSGGCKKAQFSGVCKRRNGSTMFGTKITLYFSIENSATFSKISYIHIRVFI